MALFASIGNLLDDGLPHASLVMLPSGELVGRAVNPDRELLAAIEDIMVVGVIPPEPMVRSYATL